MEMRRRFRKKKEVGKKMIKEKQFPKGSKAKQRKKIFFTFHFSFFIKIGGLAQLARASALHAEGQRFESVILH